MNITLQNDFPLTKLALPAMLQAKHQMFQITVLQALCSLAFPIQIQYTLEELPDPMQLK